MFSKEIIQSTQATDRKFFLYQLNATYLALEKLSPEGRKIIHRLDKLYAIYGESIPKKEIGTVRNKIHRLTGKSLVWERMCLWNLSEHHLTRLSAYYITMWLTERHHETPAPCTSYSLSKIYSDLFHDSEPTEINPTIRNLAYSAYADLSACRLLNNDRLKILADALEENNCQNHGLLDHLRNDQKHWQGCWALDSLLEKNYAVSLSKLP